MIVSAIVAIDKNRVIGKNNELPWYLPADLKYFKRRTIDKPIIMGRKCFESIGRPLPKRMNIVITRNPFFIATNCFMVSSIIEALEVAFDSGAEEVFIIGGGEIYKQSLEFCDFLYITEVDLEVEDGDVFFPAIKGLDWELVGLENHLKDEKNEYNYSFKKYKTRRKQD